ncbi:unnamed protein product [Euphydryas editha]|uniref:Uncharacterized protein n=1 Tax=Euphydryas editha TaxID=104508 RepID=A0AAU9U777_EUPED|nr:unnamed protein product [Euphydryas editha]
MMDTSRNEISPEICLETTLFFNNTKKSKLQFETAHFELKTAINQSYLPHELSEHRRCISYVIHCAPTTADASSADLRAAMLRAPPLHHSAANINIIIAHTLTRSSTIETLPHLKHNKDQFRFM